MKAFVFTDPSLARHARRFVWLAIDTEKKQNAAFRKKFPVQALPTFLVVDPKTERIALRWVGALTVPQLDRLASSDPLRRGRRGIDALLARADSLYGAGEYVAAANAHEEVLAAAPSDWPHTGRSVEALLFALSQNQDHARCVTAATAALPRLKGTPAFASAALYGLDCALSLPESHAGRSARIAEFEAACRAVLADTSLRIAADDRSGIHGALAQARSDAKDEAGHRAAARAWAAFLETEAARATTPEQRAVFDSHRLSAYLELGEPERSIPMLEQTRRDFPEDYNPPARLAAAYRAMKQWDRALQYADEAMSKVYGPRKLRVYDTRVEVYASSGDSTAARKTLEEAIRYAEELPAGQRSETTIAALRKKLERYR